MTGAAAGIPKTKHDERSALTIAQGLEEKLRSIEAKLEVPLGDPTAEGLADYGARWGDMVLMNTASLKTFLPSATGDRAGQVVPIKNLSTSNLTVSPAGADTVDGSAGDVTVGPGEQAMFVCQAAGKWVCFGLRQVGEIYISSQAATSITTANTFVAVAGTYASGRLVGFSHGTGGRLQYDGPGPRLVQVRAAFSFEANTADVYMFRLSVNGVTQAKTEVDRQIAAGAVNQVGAVPCRGALLLSKGDYVELWVTSESSGGVTATVRHLNLSAG